MVLFFKGKYTECLATLGGMLIKECFVEVFFTVESFIFVRKIVLIWQNREKQGDVLPHVQK